ncbi:dynein light chain type 1 [Aspergillus luchuensis]|uniref:Dynein light chain type 1 n=1 Tax=Aspergillus kawachii TaxID=1069201 RepID=A0A146FP24_ASPKA|nr:dynein light chain type 1 [Aspergillus luchuensis]
MASEKKDKLEAWQTEDMQQEAVEVGMVSPTGYLEKES